MSDVIPLGSRGASVPVEGLHLPRGGGGLPDRLSGPKNRRLTRLSLPHHPLRERNKPSQRELWTVHLGSGVPVGAPLQEGRFPVPGEEGQEAVSRSGNGNGD